MSEDRRLVMIVDDDPTLLRVLALRMELEGFEVVTASDGETALEIARDRSPAAVILDVMMPGVDGLEVCRELRSDPSTTDVPVLVLTANPKFEAEAMDAGADAFASKPFDLDELCRRVHRLLSPQKLEVLGPG